MFTKINLLNRSITLSVMYSKINTSAREKLSIDDNIINSI